MPCVVPTCKTTDGAFRTFPQPPTLAERWYEAIQLGCGLPVEARDDLRNQPGAEICQWHFRISDQMMGRYQEPCCFINSAGEYSEVASCRMCLNFHPTASMVSKAGILGDNDITYCVYELMSICFQDSDFLEMICQECLVRLELMSSMQVFFATAEDAFQEMVHLTEPKASGEKQVKIETALKAEDDLAIVEEVIEEEPMEEETVEEEAVDFIMDGYSSEEWKPEPEEPKKVSPRKVIKRGRRTRKIVRKPKQDPDEAVKPKRKKGPNLMKTIKRDTNGPLSLKNVRSRKCYICVKVLADANELLSHLTEEHAPQKQFRCEECELEFPQVIPYNVHLSRHDATERPYKCDICLLRFGCAGSKKLHEVRAHEMHPDYVIPGKVHDPVVCEHCGRVFDSKQHLASHVRTKHIKPDTVPTCNICEKTFTAKSSLERHMLLHNNEKPYACPHCERTYRRNLDLKHHVEMVHEGKNPHVCGECNQSFQSYQALYLHKRYHHDQNCPNPGKARSQQRAIRYLSCALCKVVNNTTDELTAHIERYHPNEEYPYVKCPEPSCTRTFLTTQHRAHHKEIHTDKYKCHVCGQRNASIQRLQIHMENKHTELRRYDCTICIKTYKTAWALKTHMREHSDGKRFECEFCQKTFSRKDQMRIHRRLHTGEKPFECPVCQKRFSDDGTFSKHKKRCQTMLQNQTEQQEEVLVEFLDEEEAC